MPNPNLSMVQNSILSLLMAQDRPMTMTEIRKTLNVSFQTVSNHMTKLRDQEYVIEAGRIGNAMRYKLGDPASALIQINWDGQDTPIETLMKQFANDNAPVEGLKDGHIAILIMFAKMYLMCADDIDDSVSKPVPVSIAQMKRFQAFISRRRNETKLLLRTYESMLNNDKLWDPRQIVTELIIKSEEMDPEIARSIAQNVNERLGK